MKTLILLLLACLLPAYSWACQTGANSGDIALTNLPPQILVNAGSYSAGTILYDSGQITHPTTPLRIVGVGYMHCSDGARGMRAP